LQNKKTLVCWYHLQINLSMWLILIDCWDKLSTFHQR
jgi:hypothetical protein